MGNGDIGVEHLLLGLLDPKGNTAAELTPATPRHRP
jgi:Clp amino terminal domain, pathogenicity island component